MTNHKDLDDHSSLTLVDRIKDSALLGVYSGTQCFFFSCCFYMDLLLGYLLCSSLPFCGGHG